MTIQSNKTLGGVGACLTLVGVVGTVLSILQNIGAFSAVDLGVLGVTGVLSLFSFVGFVLFFVAMHGFSRDYNERKIFSYILNGLIVAIVLAIVIGVIWFAFTLASVLTMIPAISPLPSTSPESILTPYYAPLVVVMSSVTVVWVLFNYKAYNLLADKSGVHYFRTAAIIFVAGAAVNIAAGVVFAVLALYGSIGYTTLLLASVPGGLVMYIAWAFVAKGFFSIQAPPPQPFTQPVPPTTMQVKYCPNCGAQNRIDSAYCERCGQKLPQS